MKNNLLVLISAILMWLSACQKDNNNNNPNSTTTLLKTAIVSQPGLADVMTTYEYDSQNRLKLTKYNTGDSFVLEYDPDRITEKEFDALGNLHNTNIYLLNSQGLVDSLIENDGNDLSKVTYDADNYAVKIKHYDKNGGLSSLHYMTVTNGNYTELLTTDAAGTELDRVTNSFDLNKLSTIGNSNYGQPYRGKSSANVATQSVRHLNNGTLTYDFEYLYDSKNRISSQVIRYALTGVINSAVYTYY